VTCLPTVPDVKIRADVEIRKPASQHLDDTEKDDEQRGKAGLVL
jgi:hypothetical protein